MNTKNLTLGILFGLALLPSAASAQYHKSYPIPQAPDVYGPGYYQMNCAGMIYGPNDVLQTFPPFQGMVFDKPIPPVMKEQRDKPDPRKFMAWPIDVPPCGLPPVCCGCCPPPWPAPPPMMPGMMAFGPRPGYPGPPGYYPMPAARPAWPPPPRPTQPATIWPVSTRASSQPEVLHVQAQAPAFGSPPAGLPPGYASDRNGEGPTVPDFSAESAGPTAGPVGVPGLAPPVPATEAPTPPTPPGTNVWSIPRESLQPFQVGPNGSVAGPGGVYYGPAPNTPWGPTGQQGYAPGNPGGMNPWGPVPPWSAYGGPGGYSYGGPFPPGYWSRGAPWAGSPPPSAGGAYGAPGGMGYGVPAPPGYAPPTSAPIERPEAMAAEPDSSGQLRRGWGEPDHPEGFGHGPWDRIGQPGSTPPQAGPPSPSGGGGGMPFGSPGMAYGSPYSADASPGMGMGPPGGQPAPWMQPGRYGAPGMPSEAGGPPASPGWDQQSSPSVWQRLPRSLRQPLPGDLRQPQPGWSGRRQRRQPGQESSPEFSGPSLCAQSARFLHGG